jgi:hypothetical protein
MKNIHEVLRIKEQQLQQIQKEIEALRVAARLLADESDMAPAPTARPATSTNVPVPQMIMRPAQPVAAQPAYAPKETTTYVAPSSWDITKPQFP